MFILGFKHINTQILNVMHNVLITPIIHVKGLIYKVITMKQNTHCKNLNGPIGPRGKNSSLSIKQSIIYSCFSYDLGLKYEPDMLRLVL